jgi:hypothetical protein
VCADIVDAHVSLGIHLRFADEQAAKIPASTSPLRISSLRFETSSRRTSSYWSSVRLAQDRWEARKRRLRLAPARPPGSRHAIR